MTAARTVRCQVLVVEADAPPRGRDASPITRGATRLAEAKPRTRPSELLPWADPYIAGLVRKLQSDVRDEVAKTNRLATARPATAALGARLGAPVADLEWPWEDTAAEPVATPAGGDAPSGDGLNWDHRLGR